MKPATFGGPGWKARSERLATEIQAGQLYHRSGLSTEWDTLQEVLLVAPPQSLGWPQDPDARLMLAPIDYPRIYAEFEGLCAAYRAAGVQVHIYQPPADASPNLIFARDLFWISPEGAVIGRMASQQRAGEERHTALALAHIGVVIRASLGGNAVFEGADALYMGKNDVVVGLGLRTNPEALSQLRQLFPEIVFEALQVPAGIQHLLGVMAPLGPRHVALHPAAGPDIRRALQRRGITAIPVIHDHERDQCRAMNVVALGQNRVLMPAHCPQTRAAFEAAGLHCIEVEMQEYVKAAGGPGCLSGILLRGNPCTSS